jgi:CubicO group peptidase (beta-lactamase class C family)
MHHVSGIPDYVAQRANSGIPWTEPRTKADTLAEITAVEALGFAPGDRFEYSNSNYFLLGEVVRAVTGKPIEDVVTERIFEPLGLDMRFDPAGWSPDSTDPSSARGYVRNLPEERWDPGGTRWETNGDAGIQTTPSELVRWGDNYRTGEVGGAELLDAVLADAGTAGYGAGVFELEDGGLGHQGGAPGYLSDFFVSADRRVTVAVSCNADSAMSSDLDYLARALRREWTS